MAFFRLSDVELKIHQELVNEKMAASDASGGMHFFEQLTHPEITSVISFNPKTIRPK